MVGTCAGRPVAEQCGGQVRDTSKRPKRDLPCFHHCPYGIKPIGRVTAEVIFQNSAGDVVPIHFFSDSNFVFDYFSIIPSLSR